MWCTFTRMFGTSKLADLSADAIEEYLRRRLRQGDAMVVKKYSQMQLQMKREALQKLSREANEQNGLVLVQAS